MNYSYWANAPDLMKWDILSYLASGDKREIFYVPMLTLTRKKEIDLKYLTYELGTKNESLTNFLKARFSDPNSQPSEIADYFLGANIRFNIFGDVEWFTDESRGDYFARAIKSIHSYSDKKLVFVDPDVGADIGIVRRFRSKKDMYLKGDELQLMKSSISENDYIVYFQHTGNSKYSFEKRLQDLKSNLGEWVFIAGYQRIQASLVFIFNTEREYNEKNKLIRNYFDQYSHIDHRNKFLLM
ncbi:MAG: hypothetical protein KF687_05490 [Cyclobacteriaceae bacterium]|nr:hypothetical protein [Cyclobacteriaceae bacterium]